MEGRPSPDDDVRPEVETGLNRLLLLLVPRRALPQEAGAAEPAHTLRLTLHRFGIPEPIVDQRV